MTAPIVSPSLPPIHFGLRPYLALCRKIDQALAELESRYPAAPRKLTIELRKKRLRRRKK
jgi:hypothetical protein